MNGLIEALKEAFNTTLRSVGTVIVFVVMIVFLVWLGSGCVTAPLKGGSALSGTASISQPQNPASAAEQTRTITNTSEYVIPAGSIIKPPTLPGSTNLPIEIITSAPTILRQTSGETTGQVIGAAQKDMAREVGAKMAALRPVMWVGIVLILFGVSMFHPVVFAVTGASRSFQMVCFVAGGALVSLPSLIAGHETLILICGAVAVVGYWWIRRYGEKDGLIKTLTP